MLRGAMRTKRTYRLLRLVLGAGFVGVGGYFVIDPQGIFWPIPWLFIAVGAGSLVLGFAGQRNCVSCRTQLKTKVYALPLRQRDALVAACDEGDVERLRELVASHQLSPHDRDGDHCAAVIQYCERCKGSAYVEALVVGEGGGRAAEREIAPEQAAALTAFAEEIGVRAA